MITLIDIGKKMKYIKFTCISIISIFTCKQTQYFTSMIKRILEASKVLHGQIMLKKRLISPQLAKLFLNARDLALRHLISTHFHRARTCRYSLMIFARFSPFHFHCFYRLDESCKGHKHNWILALFSCSCNGNSKNVCHKRQEASPICGNRNCFRWG